MFGKDTFVGKIEGPLVDKYTIVKVKFQAIFKLGNRKWKLWQSLQNQKQTH